MRKLTVLLVILVLGFTSCGLKRDAIGEPDVLIVVADSTDWQRTRDLVQETFAQVIPTPQPEVWYNIRRISPDRFTQFMDYKSILILSLLRANSPSLQFVERVFSKDLVESLRSGEVNVAKKENPWRAQQLLAIVTAPGEPAFTHVIRQRGKEVRGYFDEMFNQRQRKYLFGRYEQKRLENRLEQTYNWMVRIPRDWVILEEWPNENFFWVGRHLPIRWLGVYWEQVDEPVNVDSTTALRLRQLVSQDKYGDIRTNTDYVQVEEMTLDGRPAVRLRGLWEHEIEAKGGPFTGAAYYDPELQRLYYIDGQLFAPDMKKLVYLRQMEIIIATFTSGVNPRKTG